MSMREDPPRYGGKSTLLPKASVLVQVWANANLGAVVKAKSQPAGVLPPHAVEVRIVVEVGSS